MIDIEIEDARARLQLAEQQRELLEVESEPEEAMEVDPPRPQDPVFDQQSLIESISRAFADALKDKAAGFSNSSLINRLASEKDLLTFSGDSLEWLRFKRAFEQSTRLGNYTDSENVSRLYGCLTGKARECVDSLMITTESGEEIMNALELEYGSKDVILRKLVDRIRKLPSLDSGDTNIITFASTVRNNVAAMGSLGIRGYFNNPDFLNEVLKKLPSAIVYRYNDYVETGQRVPDLQTLAEFLGREAERANRAGTARLAGSSRSDHSHRDKKASSRHVHATVSREDKNSRSRSPSVI